MVVKCHGCQSVPKELMEVVPMSKDSAGNVNHEDSFKCVDDLTILEVGNLLTIGISSLNIKH